MCMCVCVRLCVFVELHSFANLAVVYKTVPGTAHVHTKTNHPINQLINQSIQNFYSIKSVNNTS